MNGAPQTILLLGGTGFIGTNLSRALVGAGHAVLVTGRGVANARLPDGVQHTPLTLAAVDELAALIAHQRVGTVVHLVSTMKPSSTFCDYLSERDEVLTPTIRLASVLAEQGTRLIYFSSGGTIYGVGSGDYAAEDDPCEPISMYGQAKLEIETQLRFLKRTRGLRTLVVRPSNPYGPYQSMNGGQGLISVLLGRVADGRALEVWGDGSSVRDYLYIDDLIATIIDLIEQDVDSTTLNIGSGEGHSLLDVVRTVEQVTGRQVALDFRPARAVDVPRLVLDVGLLRGMGLHRARPLENGVRSYAASLEMISG